MHDYEKKHLEILRPLLPECTVLLKSNGDFPLDFPQRIALYGNGARNTIKGGTGSGDVNSRFFVNVEQGLEAAGFTITTKAWLDKYDDALEKAKKDFVVEIKERAERKHVPAFFEAMGAVMKAPGYDLPLEDEGDVAIYVLARTSGEGNDREIEKGDILLNDSETRDILALNAKYKKFLLVLNVGGVVDLSGLGPVNNILLLSQLGVDTGTVLADLMLGKAYPSGKLTTSWAYAEDLPHIGEFGGRDETRYKEGIYVGYRYYETAGIKNDFPFGYGLGYTSFSVSTESVTCENGIVTVGARVTNTGDRAGKEVLQLYVSYPKGRLDHPYKSLAAFAKTGELAAGASEIVSLTFALADAAGYDEPAGSFILEKGVYVLHIGNSSADTSVCGVIELSEGVVVLQVKNACGKTDFEDYVPEGRRQTVVPDGVPVVKDTGEGIPRGKVDYDVKEEIASVIDTLSDEELVYLALGKFSADDGSLSVVGAAAKSVAGAAGETTDILADKGVPAIVMADGPAGLRLTKEYAKADGKIYEINPEIPAGLEEFLPEAMVAQFKAGIKQPPENAVKADQYATAIPIGTAIAQSFNYELAKTCGDIVGAEMERFGVQLWLAPALNIHRDIRCGRNFEYYSEDPLVSGLFAAALTEGVQRHKGCGVTIKHYAANNQEGNRYQNNSQVSERALREIYLKGFELCVKKAKPCAVMTSYNLINGVHTSESRDLIQDILRAEFGFEGIVMSDWIISMTQKKDAIYGIAKAGVSAAAGNDIFMPGCKGDFEDIMASLKAGTLSREQLKINATRMYRMTKRLRGELA